ncbi:hypothetical protein ElyMa_004443100 [Elysia marginata]|uniref:Uncharacterized protein n=1 Tax=Elysia marginata TaxID=1093978 RepID=A0AAV4HEA3_9GAST|nr:hypothetical protein ElyMa_004443100 [Elysia marginata]
MSFSLPPTTFLTSSLPILPQQQQHLQLTPSPLSPPSSSSLMFQTGRVGREAAGPLACVVNGAGDRWIRPCVFAFAAQDNSTIISSTTTTTTTINSTSSTSPAIFSITTTSTTTTTPTSATTPNSTPTTTTTIIHVPRLYAHELISAACGFGSEGNN